MHSRESWFRPFRCSERSFNYNNIGLSCSKHCYGNGMRRTSVLVHSSYFLYSPTLWNGATWSRSSPESSCRIFSRILHLAGLLALFLLRTGWGKQCIQGESVSKSRLNSRLRYLLGISTYINLSLSVRMDSILARAKSLYLLGSYTNLFLIYSFLLVESAKLLLFQMSSS